MLRPQVQAAAGLESRDCRNVWSLRKQLADIDVEGLAQALQCSQRNVDGARFELLIMACVHLGSFRRLLLAPLPARADLPKRLRQPHLQGQPM
jgi:hypothetical protein